MEDRFRFRFWDKHKQAYEYHFSMCQLDFESDCLIPEQCTGLKDKNDRLIYEGDIVKRGNGVYQVVWDEEFVMFTFEYNNKLHYFTLNNLEVIGNIHENKDILK